jgi:hypothetical protein
MDSNLSDMLSSAGQAVGSIGIGTEIKTLDKLKTHHSIALITDSGKYWTRYGADGIRAAKNGWDQFCNFEIAFHGDDVISLRADNGKYLTRWGKVGAASVGMAVMTFDDQELRAAKDEIDPYCKFTVARDASDKGFILKGDNNRYITRYGAEELRIVKEQPDEFCVFRTVVSVKLG